MCEEKNWCRLMSTLRNPKSEGVGPPHADKYHYQLSYVREWKPTDQRHMLKEKKTHRMYKCELVQVTSSWTAFLFFDLSMVLEVGVLLMEPHAAQEPDYMVVKRARGHLGRSLQRLDSQRSIR